jgi:CubicO group peptidase (beta-lactamase class C family)
VSAWRTPGDPRAGITLEHLLQMTSGLAFDQTAGDPLSDLVRMLYHERDTARFAASKPLVHPPGEVLSYASGTSNILSGRGSSTRIV